MRYLGGKTRIGRRIAEYIGEVDTYVEPFMGGLGVAPFVQARRMILSDVHPGLAVLYLAWRDGWRPDHRVTEGEYWALKAAEYLPDPLTTFAGFGLSFSGNWFAGFARCARGDDFQGAAERQLNRKVSSLPPDVRFLSSSYRDLVIPDGAVVYCDPPYAMTTRYRGTEPFDHRAFWGWARELDGRCMVLVSEYVAPDDWEPALTFEKTMSLRTKTGGREVRRDNVFMRRF